MKLNSDRTKERIMGAGAFGRIPFRTMEARLAGAEWMNHAKGLVFRFIPGSPIVPMGNVVGR